jgi:hypothetical protein
MELSRWCKQMSKKIKNDHRGDFEASRRVFIVRPDLFKSRLRFLRKKILELDDRAADDRKAFDIYNKNHHVSHFSHKGYIQWQRSDAQELLWDDIEDGKLETMTTTELWESRTEYA